ncbi:MAG: ABC transporter ATP-binding protein [Verrucomicrobiota bacterium]
MMLRFENVTKRFSGRRAPALDEVSFEVERGEVFGLLGHNGAGKSTAVGIMLGLVHADKGEVFIGGESVQKERERALGKVGAIFETPCFYDYLSGWKNLQMLTGYSGWWDEREANRMVDMVGLSGRIDDLVRTYSHGMRQRLALAQALLPRPEVLLLDEPMDGLDPDGMVRFRSWIGEMRREWGMTILLNSHLLSEVEQTCTRVAILREGKMVYEGGVRGLGSDVKRYRFSVDDWAVATEVVETAGGSVEGEGEVTVGKSMAVSDIVEGMVRAGVKVSEVVLEEEGLEDLYMRVRHDGGEGAE